MYRHQSISLLSCLTAGLTKSLVYQLMAGVQCPVSILLGSRLQVSCTSAIVLRTTSRSGHDGSCVFIVPWHYPRALTKAMQF